MAAATRGSGSAAGPPIRYPKGDFNGIPAAVNGGTQGILQPEDELPFAGPWVEFTGILYSPETGIHEWTGKIIIALPAAEKASQVELSYFQKIFSTQSIGIASHKVDHMACLQTESRDGTLLYWTYAIRVPMELRQVTEVQYVIYWDGLEIGSKFPISPVSAMEHWSIISTAFPESTCQPFLNQYACLQVQPDSYDNLHGKNRLAHVPYLCQDLCRNLISPMKKKGWI
ncbi:hypothetical protein FE257_002203 [Aspergillus nanangensis]|uniref:Uncharacterized protein n=1 Tax=Aspergillus nanangensis TaxID=2582783 RepID=A0AAD4CDC9_ASPNN|nr:hypothetical protein FE257_002203 [Aspergillus nanangensis]